MRPPYHKDIVKQKVVTKNLWVLTAYPTSIGTDENFGLYLKQISILNLPDMFHIRGIFYIFLQLNPFILHNSIFINNQWKSYCLSISNLRKNMQWSQKLNSKCNRMSWKIGKWWVENILKKWQKWPQDKAYPSDHILGKNQGAF